MDKENSKAGRLAEDQRASGPHEHVGHTTVVDEESEDDPSSDSKFGLSELLVIAIILAVIFGAGYAVGHYVLHWGKVRSLIAAPVVTALVCLLIAIAGWLDLFD